MNNMIKKHESKETGRPASDLSGKTFGRWSVLRLDSRGKRGRAFWKCRCECGEIRLVRHDALTRSVSNSCGCLSRELSAERATTHGLCVNNNTNGNRTYVSWKSMKQRCYDPNKDNYADYGGRGIRVCERWRDNFENFLSDMGERPPGTTIDRFNSDGDYKPSNCRWADLSTQNKNKRSHATRRSLGGSSKYKGVSKHNKNWQAQCGLRGKYHYLGTFKIEIQAAIAYDEFAAKNCGTRAWLNREHFPEIKMGRMI